MVSPEAVRDPDSVTLAGTGADLPPDMERQGGLTIYQMLARMPFIDRLELSYLYGVTPTTCHRYLDLMERSGILGWFEYATRHLRSSRRYYLTRQGLDLVQTLEGESLRDRYPVSRQWQRSLSHRIDAIASIYRLAASMATETCTAPIFVRPCIRGPWDAFVEFPNGAMVGVLRQGVSMSRHAMSDRFWRMSRREGGPPPLTIFMASDDMERREAAKRLMKYPLLPSVAVCEFDVLDAERAGENWELPNNLGGMFSMPELIGDIERAGHSGQDFSEYWKWNRRDGNLTFDDDDSVFTSALSFLLTGAEKRFLDMVHDWPLSKRSHFMSMLDISPSRLTKVAGRLTERGLVMVVRVRGSGRKRYALTDEGLAYLCRRDRVEHKAKLDAMSAERREDGEFRGGALRVIESQILHNDGLNDLLGHLWGDPRRGWRRMMAIPTSRSKRRFLYSGEPRFVMPDAFVELEAEDGHKISAMVEYERRAKYRSWMKKKIAPYRRYFGSGTVYSDCLGIPVVLFVFSARSQETVFIRSVWRDQERSGIRVPFACTTMDLVREVGPLEAIWRIASDSNDARRVRLIDMAVS